MWSMPSALEDLVGSMSISELAQRSGKTIEAITAFALGDTNGSPRAKASPQSTATRLRKETTGQRTTATARAGSFDEKVLAAIVAAGGEARSVDIEAAVGGTAEERRGALHRLVAAKKLKRSGIARATKYAVR